MSNRRRGQAISLWWVYPAGRLQKAQLFAGTLQDVVAHINALHRRSGAQFVAREA